MQFFYFIYFLTANYCKSAPQIKFPEEPPPGTKNYYFTTKLHN